MRRSALVLLVVALPSCGRSAPPPAPSTEGKSILSGTVRPCVPPPTVEPDPTLMRALLPLGLALPDDAAIVQTTNADGTRTVVARTRLSPSELHARYLAQVEAAGYAVLKVDDEVVEAELYFSLPDGGLGLAQQVKARCPVGETQTILSTVSPGAGPVTTVPHAQP